MYWIPFLIIFIAVIAVVSGYFGISVTLDCEGIKQARRLPEHWRGPLQRFAKANLEPGTELKLKGVGQADGTIRWRFSRNLDPETVQRFRNGLMLEVNS